VGGSPREAASNARAAGTRVSNFFGVARGIDVIIVATDGRFATVRVSMRRQQ
jgi:hypothetical protein